MRNALVLVPPNIPSMDSAAGGRYQATYNTVGTEASHWIPLWVCYAAAAVSTTRAMDCNVEGLTRDEFLRTVPPYDIYVFYANQETIAYDCETALLLKRSRPNSFIVFAGPYSTVASEVVVQRPGIDAVIRGEIEQPLRELCKGMDPGEVLGLTWKDGEQIIVNPGCRPLEDLDSLRWVSRIIRRDLPLLRYRIPYLNYPYISLFSGRGCRSHCTFCLWPQTISGHRYRTRSVADVAEEMRWVHHVLPMVREIQIEDDTFTCDTGRVLELCDALEGAGITWSCCARYDVDGEVLYRMKRAGARNLVVGFESGDDQILKNVRKGLNTTRARTFMDDCRRVGLRVHGCFIFGLPGETRQTMEHTLAYAMELRPDTAQFAIASAYEGTEFNAYLRANQFIKDNAGITATGHLCARYDYPALSGEEINLFTHKAWKAFYLRPRLIMRELVTAMSSREDAKRFVHGAHYVLRYLFMRNPHKKTN